jgi:hypothetical protein
MSEQTDRRSLRERPGALEVVLAVAAVVLWAVALLGLFQLIPVEGAVIWLPAVAATVATFVVSGRRHASVPASSRYRRTVVAIVFVAVIAWLGWAIVVAWGMRDWTF